MSMDNLSPAERWVSMLSGFALLAGAVPRGSWLRRAAFMMGGATLLSRGMSGYCGLKAAFAGDASLAGGLNEQWQRTRARAGAGAAGIDSLETLHLEEMQELASSTGQLAGLLDEIEGEVEHSELGRSVRSLATQLHSREQDLERVISSRGASPRRHPDQAMQALTTEVRKMARIASPAVRDAALVDSLQRLIHYQIAAEGSAAAHAKAVGRDSEAALFAEWADRDKATDAALTELARGLINPQATFSRAAAGVGGGAGAGAGVADLASATGGEALPH